ncbi:MAG: FecR domain-containing protein [Elusimicrobia bacterium]|nr:FecR domain-containing protein [Elusimicrobiota bacterium]MDE2510531.1 FecR domain-containing protein [Elusimicrobiota bacterium]
MMLKRMGWTAALALLLGLGAAPARAAGEAVAGVVIVIKGAPTVMRKGTHTFRKLKLNQYVNEGDELVTKAGEFASIAFIGGAEVRISESSTFVVENGGGTTPTQLFTSLGKAWTRLLSGHSGINIRTPSAVAAVRGTEADVEAGDHTTVKVYEGHVDVFNDHGKQALTAGQMTHVASAQVAPEPPKSMTAADRQNWQDALQGKGVEKQIERLQKEADRRRSLELRTKDGKKIKLNLEKK